MKILSFVLSITMFITSIPYVNVYGVGIDDFKDLVKEKSFVDKSLFIKEIMESNNKAMLITRPRRWGKSLSLSMLRYFFMPEVAADGQPVSKDYRENLGIFEKLKINSGYIDTREIINRILLSQDIDRSFKDNHGRILEIAQGQNFGDKDSVLEGHTKRTLKDITPLKMVVKEYGEALETRFSGVSNLSSSLNQLNQLDKEIRTFTGTEEKKKLEARNQAQAAYNKKFEELRQQIEGYIGSNTDFKKELSKEFDLINRHQGQYPTILLSLKDTKENTYQGFEDQLRLKISQVFGGYPYLLNGLHKQSKDISDYANQRNAQLRLEKFNSILERKASYEDLKDSLRFLSELLHNYHGKKTYILIDEYDAPYNYLFKLSLEHADTAEQRKALLDTTSLITNILSSCGKDNPSLEKIVLTGIFDTLKKESGSGFNNVSTFGITNPYLKSHFGFSAEEVERLINGKNKVEILKNIHEWYNGYSVEDGERSYRLFTPWSVVNYLDNINRSEKVPFPLSYWVASGIEDIFKDALQHADNKIWEKLNFLAQGEEVAMDFDYMTALSNYDPAAHRTQEKLLSYLLVNLGYLTPGKEGHFKTPNLEVKENLLSIVQEISASSGGSDVGLIVDPFVEALIKVDESQIRGLLEKYILNIFSYLDVPQQGKKNSVEKSYQMFVLGLVARLHKTHIIKSERETGKGRADILIIPRPIDNHVLGQSANQAQGVGFIIELKKGEEDELEKLAEDALFQIEQGKYAQELLDNKVKNIVSIAIACSGKSSNFQMRKNLNNFNEQVEWKYVQAALAKKTPRSTVMQPQSDMEIEESKQEGLSATMEVLNIQEPITEAQVRTQLKTITMLKNSKITKLSSTDIDKLVEEFGEEVFNQSVENLKVVKGVKDVKAKAIHAKGLQLKKQSQIPTDERSQKRKPQRTDSDYGTKKINEQSQEEEDAYGEGASSYALQALNLSPTLMGYYGRGLDEIIALRLKSVVLDRQHWKGNVSLSKSQSFNEHRDTLSQLVAASGDLVVGQKLLVPLNLYNRHWVGLVIEEEDKDSLRVVYIDPENKAMPERLQAKLKEAFKDRASFSQYRTEPQKYGNCGPEVIENFVQYLTGQRASQEEAVPLHSALVERQLLGMNAEDSSYSRRKGGFIVLTPEDDVFHPMTEEDVKLKEQLLYGHLTGVQFDSAQKGIALGYRVAARRPKNPRHSLWLERAAYGLEEVFYDEKLRNQRQHYLQTGVVFDSLERARRQGTVSLIGAPRTL